MVFATDYCPIHRRWLTVGEMDVGACSTCEPHRFQGRCIRCGEHIKGKSCPHHYRGKFGEQPKSHRRGRGS